MTGSAARLPWYRQPPVILAIIMVTSGLAILAPTAIARASQELTMGRLVDVLPQPIADNDQEITIGLLFEFPLAGNLKQPQILALGWGRCDALGRSRAPERIPAEEWRQRLREYQDIIEQGEHFQVFYQPEQPELTARIYDSRLGISRLLFAILLIATPFLLWLVGLVRQLLRTFVPRYLSWSQ